MRLVRLSVQRFGCIEAAELDFGPGLNVLYGPNDLGKSTLAQAIRAALLLQHGAALHEEFISWYGGGDPQVTLTLCDDEDRFWRVSKTFGAGTVGRSRLESSKDGRTFTDEGTGRNVDDKLRMMLRWGVQRPGGQGPRGLPASFLTHVLLAEQDEVSRLLLQGESLEGDPDESGRLRLSEALDALAQDPTFKQVLDAAQAQVDTAFTPTGQKKRGRNSPFVAVAERITGMQRERDELAGKVRDTAAAEARIQLLGEQRTVVHQKLEAAGAALNLARKQLAGRLRRDDLRTKLQAEQARVVEVEAVQRQIDQLQADAPRRRAVEEASAAALREAASLAQQREAERDAARARLDAFTQPDPAGDQRLAALEERRKLAEERVRDADREVEREAETLRLARACAKALVEAGTAATATGRAAKTADEVAQGEADALARAQQSLDEARQRLREAQSGDRASARERQRAELENRRLILEAARVEAARAAERARAVGEAVRLADEAESARDDLTGQVEGARATVAVHEAAIVAADADRATLRNVRLFAQLRQLSEAVAAARIATAAAGVERARVVVLRREAADLRAQVPHDLPSAEAIAGVRSMRDELRLAEARLGGGLSVTVRAARPIVMQATPDGVADGSRKMPAGDEVTVTATRELALAIDGLVDIEISAGEERARDAAAQLKKRWTREGARLLRAQKVDSVEALAARRAGADEALRAAADREREAGEVEARAARPPESDEGELKARAAAVEQALGGEDRGRLAAALEALGTVWQASLDVRQSELDRLREVHASKLAGAREQLTRLETQREGQARQAEAIRQEAVRRQAELPGDWAALVAQQQTALQAAERALTDNALALTGLSSGDDDGEQAARAQVGSAEQAAALARQRSEQARGEAQKARDAAVQATTRLQDTSSRARELDGKGVWAATLAANGGPDGPPNGTSDLDVASWQEALAAAEERRAGCRRERAAVLAELAQLDEDRRNAIQRAREESATADERLRVARTQVGEVEETSQKLTGEHSRITGELTEMRVRVASANLAEAYRATAALQAELGTLEAEVGSAPAQPLDEEERAAARLSDLLRETEDELARARGALEQVGGAVVRERQRELDQAIGQERERERATEIEFDAWKLLVDTLRETESAEGAHLGRALAGPVSERFASLTGGRYDRLELGPHLETSGLRAAGQVRDIGTLSAGTQDQLATLLRVCIAEQLRSAIVLDDHLSQSDPARVAWFNDVLRAAARQVQIILITCRPTEVVAPEEIPGSGEAIHSGAAGLVRVVDLSRVITRFASPVLGGPGARA